MGMFDWFEADEKYADTFRCGKCGGGVSGLQTKDFDCDLGHIRLGADATLESKGPEYEDEDGPSQRWRIIKDTCYARVYSSCIADDQWNEWRLHVREGNVTEIVRVIPS